MPTPDPRFAGTRLLPSGFSDDDGSCPQALGAALADGDRLGVLRELGQARLLVPVVAILGEVEYDDQGLAHDKSSDMAAVLLQGRDGRLALLAFTSIDSLHAWNPEARPVPVAGQTAAQSAIQDDAAALLIDVAGPTSYVVGGDDLRGLAQGWTPALVDGSHCWLEATEPTQTG